MPRPARFALICLLTVSAPAAVLAQEAAKFSALDIAEAEYNGGDLPAGRSALTAKVQILLDRSGTSPGVIDGFKGGMSDSAIRAFERREGLPIDGRMDIAVWDLLQPYAGEPLIRSYTLTEADIGDLVDAIPTDYAEKARMSAMAFTSVAEKLGERFHMDERFIAYLNPGIGLTKGATIHVINPSSPVRGHAARILIDKKTRRVAAYDASGKMLADYPATIGSDQTPSPSGDHRVARIALNPDYTYNPKVNFKQGNNDKVLTVPPGPNGPVGTVWIALSKPTYGIHGTPTPSQLFKNQSRGCVRLTNWDAWELAHLVQPGQTKVEFLPDGLSIAAATGVPDVASAAPTISAPGTPESAAPRSLATEQPEGLSAKVFEDTSEENATPISDAPGSGADLLADALADLLPTPQAVAPKVSVAPAGILRPVRPPLRP